MPNRSSKRGAQRAAALCAVLLTSTGACGLVVDTSVPTDDIASAGSISDSGSSATSNEAGEGGSFGQAGDADGVAGEAGSLASGGGNATGGAATGGSASHAGSTSAGGTAGSHGGVGSAGGTTGGAAGSTAADCTPAVTSVHVESACAAMDGTDTCHSTTADCPGSPEQGVDKSKEVTIGGSPAKMYDVSLTITGDVEVQRYTSATSIEQTLVQGGTPSSTAFAICEIDIVDADRQNPQTFFLNSVPDDEAQATIRALHIEHVFRVAGESTLKVRIHSSDCIQHTNCNCLAFVDGKYDCQNSPLAQCNSHLGKDTVNGDRQFLDTKITSCAVAAGN